MSPFEDDRIRVFRAKTTHEALRRVRLALGGDAVVLRTRQVVEPAAVVGGKPERLVEVTASSEPLRNPAARPPAAQSAPVPLAAPVEQYEAPPQPTPVVDSVAPTPPPVDPPSADLDQRLETIESALLELLRSRAQSPAAVAAPVPVVLPSYQPAIASLITSKPDGRVTIAIVGSTGVGKTTTVAKIAARASLYEQKQVAVISVDATRAGADRSLQQLASVLGVPICSATTAAEVAAASDEFAACDLLLIDSGGIGPTEAERAASLLDLLSPLPLDQVLLALSAAHSESSWAASARAVAAIEPDAVVLTKVDELVDVAALHAITQPIAAVTNGREIPQHLVDAADFDWASLASATV